MQKLLITLTALFFSSSTLTPLVPNIPSQTKTSLALQNFDPHENRQAFLDVPRIEQIGEDYCVAASLVSIFKFWGWEENKTQGQIFQEARNVTETPSTEEGVRVNIQLATYVNNFIHEATGQNANYAFNGLGITFGISLDDITVFSTYVWDSLSNNVPLILGMHPERGLGHSLILCGYQESIDNHWYDEYFLMDPADGKIYNILAQDLHRSFKYGFTIIGRGNILPAKRGLEIDLEQFTNELRDLPGNEVPVFAGEVHLNLTKHTGISDFSYFTTAFMGLSLPSLQAEIKKVNDDPVVLTGFGMFLDSFPSTNIDQWRSALTIFHTFSEAIGCETIKTWVGVETLIERAQNNNLILYLRFYGAAKVTREANSKLNSSNYELTGRIKITSGPKLNIIRNLQPQNS
ncbi:papain like cysteine protease AvrRpt2 [Entomoplasma freundtii]|uniref:Uncharacterized protein n=1 Tax=Entomoplasma freundtii TaxID=74700 RepID=A0A2K8NQN9_9MOLU|nr:C39 family peptidase [Entomoplasma freundtii]ATZ16152.1 hypothetical protein EFREU_v1c01250 [Entomoplasma freundtii]TDY56947.1 papain like cysteine protease AvrRpt2 [Entomoplasma freundtii]